MSIENNESNNIISEALKKYDLFKYYTNLLIYNYESIEIVEQEDTRKRLLIRFVNDLDVLESEFEVIGSYLKNESIWIWSWSSDLNIEGKYSKALNQKIKDLLIYSLNIDKKYYKIFSLISMPRGVINDRYQIDINIAIASYYLKCPFIATIVNHELNINYYIVLLNHDEILKKLKKYNINHNLII